ncbi:HNH endonuclease [Deinococcus sp.]|uniref:HNH endonuclease n=1 Tax=Deinococcus sp. TaxID=47478 RepID=UPI0034C65CFE
MKLLPFATTQTPRGYYKNSPDSFWARVKRGDPKACWPWQGTISRTGYGVITYHKRQWRTHRLAWVLTHGEIPEGLFVCHHCDNPICCNPQHLFLGTPLDNARDMVAKGRSCKGEKHAVRKGTRTMLRGDEHPLRKNPAAAARGERNSAAILTEAEVLEIRRRAAEGETIYRLAKVFSVSKRTIQFIVRGKTWRHLLEE